MIGFVAKLGVVGGALSGVVLLDGIGMNTNRKNQEKQVTKAEEDFKSIDDIELFEGTHGCSFVYISAWTNKVLYSARGMVDNVKIDGRDINAEVIKAANNGKATYKSDKGVITLNNNGNSNWQLKPKGENHGW